MDGGSATGQVIRVAAPRTRCVLVTSIKQATKVFAAARAAGVISPDFETVRLDPHTGHLISLQVSHEEGRAHFMNFTHSVAPRLDQQEILGMLADVMVDPNVVTVGANLKFEWKWLMKNGISKIAKPWDVLAAAHILDGSRDIGLKSLAREDLGMSMRTYRDVVGKRASLEEVPFDDVLAYGCADPDATLRLYHKYRPLIDARHPVLIYKVEMPLVPVLASMELAGVGVDPEHLTKLLPGYKRRQAEAGARIRTVASRDGHESPDEINLDADHQIKAIVRAHGIPLREKTRKGNDRLDGDVLAALVREYPRDKLLPAIQEYRLTRTLQNHVKGLIEAINPVTGRIHPSFNQFSAGSFRLSCSEPNLQNVPKKSGKDIRLGFVPHEGCVFVRADLNQVELHVLAHQADERRMKEAFADGADLHAQTATECFGDGDRRDDAKTINFGRIYGMTEYGLRMKIGISLSEARRWLEKHARAYPGVPRFHKGTERQVHRRGYVETILGARRYFSRQQRLKRGWERAAYNHPVQGSAGEVFKYEMVRIHAAIRPYGARIVLSIHDELVIECPASEAPAVGRIVARIMEEGLKPNGTKPVHERAPEAGDAPARPMSAMWPILDVTRMCLQL